MGATDFLAWQRGSGIAVGAAFNQGDADRDGDVDGDDLAIWESSFSAISPTVHTVPESSAWGLLLIGAIVWGSAANITGFSLVFTTLRLIYQRSTRILDVTE